MKAISSFPPLFLDAKVLKMIKHLKLHNLKS